MIEMSIDQYNDMAERLAELEWKLGEREWIPCSERLPEKDELVLVTVWNGVSIAWRNIYGGWESAEDMYEKGDVTAWMPLPTPYKGGELPEYEPWKDAFDAMGAVQDKGGEGK